MPPSLEGAPLHSAFTCSWIAATPTNSPCNTILPAPPSPSTAPPAQTQRSTATSPHPFLPSPSRPSTGQLRLHIFVDMSSIEIFANDGKVVMTLLTYPGENQHGIEVFSGSPIKLARFSAWTLSSIWNGSPAFTIQSGSTYKLQARQDAKVVTAPAKIGAAPLYESDWIDEPTQQWKIDLVEPGAWHDPARWIPPSYRLTNQASGKVMDLRDDLAGDGSVTGLSVWSNRDDQKWQINGVGGGFYTILPKKSSGNGRGQTLEEQSTSLPRVERNGTPLRVGRFLAEHSQEWKLVSGPLNRLLSQRERGGSASRRAACRSCASCSAFCSSRKRLSAASARTRSPNARYACAKSRCTDGSPGAPFSAVSRSGSASAALPSRSRRRPRSACACHQPRTLHQRGVHLVKTRRRSLSQLVQ